MFNFVMLEDGWLNFMENNIKYCGSPLDISCDNPECEDCCEHNFDSSEGYTCINCGKQGDIGALIDAAEYDMDR
jgi:anaerobic ribonucleoside-triphosphate reductase